MSFTISLYGGSATLIFLLLLALFATFNDSIIAASILAITGLEASPESTSLTLNWPAVRNPRIRRVQARIMRDTERRDLGLLLLRLIVGQEFPFIWIARMKTYQF
ncbi:MAG: hypothetical protein DMD91_30745 [Candidatus Rokuibacteriota bacterium]|nr:MAG: hypothetical protein DMD91_30745 [Candidatus Rokubacteria bacterium]